MGTQLLETLVQVRGWLLDPTEQNLDRSVPALRAAIETLREAQSAPTGLPGLEPEELSKVVKHIRLLHEQAGRIRFGAARFRVAETAGYTRDGEVHETPSAPHMAISG